MASTPTKLYTAEDLLEMPEDEFQYEVIEGRLITMPGSGWEHSNVAAMIVYLLVGATLQNGLARVSGADGIFRLRLRFEVLHRQLGCDGDYETRSADAIHSPQPVRDCLYGRSVWRDDESWKVEASAECSAALPAQPASWVFLQCFGLWKRVFPSLRDECSL